MDFECKVNCTPKKQSNAKKKYEDKINELSKRLEEINEEVQKVNEISKDFEDKICTLKKRIIKLIDYPKKTWDKEVLYGLILLFSIALILLFIFLICDIFSSKNYSLPATKPTSYESYTIYRYIYMNILHTNMIKRSVGLFCGFAIMLFGNIISFYVGKKQIKILALSDILKENTKYSTKSDKNKIAAAVIIISPAITTLIVGALIMIFSIYSQDKLPDYNSNTANESTYKNSEESNK